MQSTKYINKLRDGFIAVKVIVLIFHRRNLYKVLNAMDQYFWPIDKCEPELRNQINLTNSYIKKILLTVTVMTGLTTGAYIAKPIFVGRVLPMDTYHPVDLKKSPDFEIAYFLQIIILLKCLSIVLLPFDFLFIALIIHIVYEFRMIGSRLTSIMRSDKNADEKSWLTEIRLIGKHHSMVLRCVKCISKIYSVVLLNQFVTVMFLICMGLFSIVASGFPPNSDILIRATGYVITFSSLLFLYCIAGAFLTDESKKVADAAFQSKWWITRQPKIRKSVMLIIRRAQKVETLTAGGMANLNLETFNNVIKNALSFFMVANALFVRAQQN